MVKCVVSSCLNREQPSADRGSSRAPKRFFSLPKDPARVKVWLAALRESGRQDWAENHVICEDHFLPEDISEGGVSADAIPIMPPCLEEELGIDAWPEDPDEDDGWATGDANDDEEENYEEEEDDETNVDEDEANEDEANEEAIEEDKEEANVDVTEEGNEEGHEDVTEDVMEDMEVNEEQEETAPTDDTQTVTEGSTEAADRATAPPADGPTAAGVSHAPSPAPAQPPPPSSSSWEPKKNLREDVSLLRLTRGFLELLLNGDGSLDVRDAARTLQSKKRRVYDITNILMGVDLIRKESVNRVRWTGKCPISSLLWEKPRMQQESLKLKQVEETLDGLIKSCAQQLFAMTDDRDNANAAFVTFADVQDLAPFRDQTVIVVKAPEETKLEVPAPKEDRIQVHLKSGSGPISVLTCDIRPDATGRLPPPTFLQIQHSHIRTTPLQTESSSQSAVLSL